MTCRIQANNPLHDALKEVIQKALYAKLITPREDSLPDEVDCKEWQIILFLKCGRSFITTNWIYPTEGCAEEVCKNIRESMPAEKSLLCEWVNSGVPIFFTKQFSPLFPNPKEPRVMDNYIIVEMDDTTAILAEQHTRVDRIGASGEPKVSIFYKKVANFNSVSTAVEFMNTAKKYGG